MTVYNLARRRILKCVSGLSRFGTKSLPGLEVHNLSLFKRKNATLTPTQKGPWSVLFFGSDEFALDSLRALHNQYRLQKLLCRLEVVTAYKGKENCLTKYAKENGITVHQWPVNVNNLDFHIGVVVSFGHLIPSHIINSFPLGIINVHASLLPRWRGSAPIIYALMNGDTETGISLMKIKPKRFDVGEVIAQEKTTVGPEETQPELYTKLARMGSKLLIKTVEKLPDVLCCGIPQSEESVTYGTVIYNKESDSLLVKCKENTWISIKKIRIPGKPQMPALDFRNGFMGGQKLKSCNFY
ncbi:methionyl-tRNA formyltransferase, mitochondrial isoform X2 [Belonocnema kinseyi]|uniref:methionyl-tRNA formyltransferase, mitochondrial isoform X2 n=1 Tax=Belonocnema kinseyi TaxID=2817044 RepID=UPI00143D3DBF|nr:methionyl-tRNA formyltransferase, mitochondrial isoform X2 [Belonocnema kinseyi]